MGKVNQLPFLDILILKCNPNYQTTVYRKKAFAGIILTLQKHLH